MLGVWFLSSIGANALQVTLTLNIGGEGVAPDRKGLNISSIYGTNWGVRHTHTPQLVPSRPLMFSHLLVSKLCCGNITLCMLLILSQNCAKHCLFTSKCLLSVSRPIFFYSLIRNLIQAAQNIVFSQVQPLCFPSHFFYSLIRNLFRTAKNIVFSQVNATCVSRPIFSIP